MLYRRENCPHCIVVGREGRETGVGLVTNLTVRGEAQRIEISDNGVGIWSYGVTNVINVTFTNETIISEEGKSVPTENYI